MDEIFSKFDGGSTAATVIRAGVDGDTLGTVVLTVTAGRKHIYFAVGGDSSNPLALLDSNGLPFLDSNGLEILDMG